MFLFAISISRVRMAKIKAVKVSTPGSQKKSCKKNKKRKAGRPNSVQKAGKKRDFTPRRVLYTEADMLEAVRLVKEEELSIKAAALETNSVKKNSVPRTTLSDRLRWPDPQRSEPLGRKTELSKEVEDALVYCLVKCAEFNYPLRKCDLQDIVQEYVTEHDIHTRFPRGRPGREWCRYFLRRHRHEVKIRRPTNIRRSRAQVSPDIVKAYHEKLSNTIRDIPPVHIFNYDETNLRDDPGSEAAFFHVNHRHCEKVQNHSKVAYSIMFCVSAAGDMLPPMTVYKSNTDTIYKKWSKEGPPGSVFVASPSGWFDMKRFNVWFDEVLLPYMEDLPRNGF